MASHLSIEKNGLLPWKTHDLLASWSWGNKWQIKNIKSPLPECFWPPIFAGWQLIGVGSCPKSRMAFDRVVLKDHVKKPLNLQYHSAYGNQTGQVDDLPWGAPIHIVTWLEPSGLDRSRDNMKNLCLHFHKTYGQ